MGVFSVQRLVKALSFAISCFLFAMICVACVESIAATVAPATNVAITPAMPFKSGPSGLAIIADHIDQMLVCKTTNFAKPINFKLWVKRNPEGLYLAANYALTYNIESKSLQLANQSQVVARCVNGEVMTLTFPSAEAPGPLAGQKSVQKPILSKVTIPNSKTSMQLADCEWQKE